MAYVSICTRPDLKRSISYLSRHLHDRAYRHLPQAERAIRYISGSIHHGLLYQSGESLTPESLGVYVDDGVGGENSTRKSTIEFFTNINSTPVI